MTAAIERFVPAGIALLGTVQLLTGVVMLADPGFFYREIASYAPPNDHFTRDLGTFTVAIGLALLWSARTPSWRLPLLAFALVQFVLHTVNHLVDLDATETSSHGPVNLAAIALGTAFVALLLVAEVRRRGAGRRGP